MIDVAEPQPVPLNSVPVEVYEPAPVLVMVTVDTQQHWDVSQPSDDQVPSHAVGS